MGVARSTPVLMELRSRSMTRRHGPHVGIARFFRYGEMARSIAPFPHKVEAYFSSISQQS
jgi:hypothetical protein